MRLLSKGNASQEEQDLTRGGRDSSEERCVRSHDVIVRSLALAISVEVLEVSFLLVQLVVYVRLWNGVCSLILLLQSPRDVQCNRKCHKEGSQAPDQDE